jgi:two-component system, cell cycle sensor histidine kinase and response regulator CckA
MNTKSKTKKDLIEEISTLKQKIKEMEQAALSGKPEEELLLSNFILSTQLEMSPDGILIVDAGGRMILWNKRFVEMWGIPSHVMETKSDDLAIKSVLDKLVDPDQFLSVTRRLYNDINAKNHDEPALIDGRTFDRYSAPVIGSDGIHYGRIWYFRDITKRKKAEDALRESDSFSSSLIRFLHESMIVVSWDGNILFANEAAAKLIETASSGDLLSRNIVEFLHADSRQEAIEDLVAMQEGKDEGLIDEYKLITTKGRTLWVEVLGGLIPFHGESAALICIRDITERKLTEEALWESEERFFKAFNASPAPITISEIETSRFIDVNEQACRTLEYTREEMIGRTSYELGVWDDPEERARLGMQLLNDGSFREIPVRFITKYGSNREVLWSADVITLGSRKVLLSLFFDITERKRMEARLIQAQKLEAIGTLSGGLTHNFNNILNGIQGYATMLRLKMKPDNLHSEWLNNILEQVQSGADLTRQLLGFARKEQYETTLLDINKVLTRSADLFGKAKKEVVMHMNLAQGSIVVMADHNQMEQVFLNLFTNASQAMPRGGNIHMETQLVSLNSNDVHPYEAAPGTYVKISVKDTGMGMDAKTLERIFEPFFTTKPEGQGTGLGLSSVYGIIKGHKGFITVDSKVDHGTTFTIYLPATKKEMIPEEVKTPEILTGSETILIVDDEAASLEVSREFLKFLGYRVFTVGSGQEALAVYMEKSHEIDMIILDMIMPGISGEETFDRLREINPVVKVLLSSGYGISFETQQILDRGCNGFIKKPFHLAILSQKIREILDVSGEAKTRNI